jgi:hypothetical protein
MMLAPKGVEDEEGGGRINTVLCGLFENAVNSCDHIVSSDM